MRVRFGEYELDTETRTLQRAGRRISVQSKAFDLLAYLIEHRERVVSSYELLDALWPGLHVSPAALSRAVLKTRQAVGDDGEHQAVIHTEHGKGFRFVAQISIAPAPEEAAQAPASRRARRVGAASLAVLLIAGGIAWFLTRPAEELAPIRSLAVLPLANLSGDPEQAYFSDGMTEELINSLAKISALRVISRTSAMHYKGTDKTLPEIARELNVDALIEGSVLHSGDRVRITAQLVQGSTDRHLWSGQYEHDLRDVLILQSEVAQAIASEIRVVLTPQDEKRLAEAHVVDPQAYELVIKGDYYLDKQEFERATELIKEAIVIDPDYALAYALLSFSYSLRATWMREDPGKVIPQAKLAVRQALELDASLSITHNALAEIAVVERNWSQAEKAFKRAIELDSGESWAHHNYAHLLLMLGRVDEAVVEATRAQQLNPLADLINAKVIDVRRAEGRYQEAIQEGRRALALNPNFQLVRQSLVWACIDAGESQQAIVEARDFVKHSEGSADSVWTLSWALFRAGRVDESIELQRSNVEANSDYAPSYLQLGFLYTYAGQIDQSIHNLLQSFTLSPGSWFYMALARRFLTLGDPEAAARWLARSDGLGPDKTHALAIRHLLHRYQRQDDAALAIARLLGDSAERPSIDGERVEQLIWLRDLQRVDPQAALNVYARLYPELLENPPIVRKDNCGAAVSLAWLHIQTGDEGRSEPLLRECLAIMKLPAAIAGGGNHGFSEVMAYAIQGNKEEAMTVLEQELDSGWLLDWWMLRVDPAFEPLWGVPAFQKRMAEVEAEMAEQLANLRTIERNGEPGAIPEISTATQ